MRSVIALLAVSCSAPAASQAPTAPPRPAPPAVAAPTPAAAPPARAGLRYPAARTGDVVDTFHGVAVPDPYRWLEEMTSDQTRQWVRDENAVTDAYLAGLSGRETLRRRIAELVSFE